MRITKVKYDGAKTRIEYERKRLDGRGFDDYTINCSDAPLASFRDAFNVLAADVIGICELHPDEQSKLTIRGVTFTNTNDIFGACITALKKLKTANAPLVLNTPHLTEEPYGEGDTSTPLLDSETADRLHTLALEAERYVNGEREQGDLLSSEQGATVGAVDPQVGTSNDGPRA
jgi:hypothetical protein